MTGWVSWCASGTCAQRSWNVIVKPLFLRLSAFAGHRMRERCRLVCAGGQSDALAAGMQPIMRFSSALSGPASCYPLWERALQVSRVMAKMPVLRRKRATQENSDV